MLMTYLGIIDEQWANSIFLKQLRQHYLGLMMRLLLIQTTEIFNVSMLQIKQHIDLAIVVLRFLLTNSNSFQWIVF